MKSLDSLLKQVDWDFPNVINDGLHTLHWYPASFVAAIPGSLIPFLSDSDACVADPFCGSGTTGVEALRLGRKFVGADINPVAVLVSNAKVAFADPDRLCDVFGSDLMTVRHVTARHPNEQELLRWYHPDTYRELFALYLTISEISDRVLSAVSQAIFSSILKNVSSQTKHWGWVCDNVAPKPAEIHYRPALNAFLRALDTYITASEQTLTEIKTTVGARDRRVARAQADVRQLDAIELLNKQSQGSIDLMLTSPPYLGVTDYVKAQRLTFLWLAPLWNERGLFCAGFEELRRAEVGARSQRYRAESPARYRDYMFRFFGSAYDAVRRQGVIIFVVGDSSARASSTQIIRDAAANANLRLAANLQRKIRDTRRRLMARVDTETILVYIRP